MGQQTSLFVPSYSFFFFLVCGTLVVGSSITAQKCVSYDKPGHVPKYLNV